MINILFKIHLYVGFALALLLPIYQKIIPLLIVVWAISFFISRGSKEYWRHLKQFKIGWLSIVFFILNIFALIYTDHWDSGVFDIESKLSFFIFPLVLASSVHFYRKVYIENLLFFFVIGLLFASMYCLYIGFYRVLALDASFQYLTYIDLSVIMHPSYFSMYLCFGVLIVYHRWKINLFTKFGQRVFYILSLALFVLMILLLSSKTGIIVLFLVLLAIIHDLVKRKIAVFALLFLTLSLFTVIFLTNDRFESMRGQVSHLFSSEQLNEKESSGIRIVLWNTASDMIAENWLFGIGGGDLKYELTEKAGIKTFDKNDNRIYFNAHNQWLETFLSVGVIGLLLILSWLVLPMFKIVSEYRIILIGLFIIILVNGIFESVFNRQEGVIFIVFFWTFLAAKTKMDWYQKKGVSKKVNI